MGKKEGIKKFKEFKEFKSSKKEDNPYKGEDIKKSSEKEDLSTDINLLDKVLDKVEKIEGEIEIVSINDVSMDKPDLSDPKLSEAIIINADLSGEKVKRGDIIWITAMIKKGSSTLNSMGVFKCRITDMYQGLSILNSIK